MFLKVRCSKISHFLQSISADMLIYECLFDWFLIQKTISRSFHQERLTWKERISTYLLINFPERQKSIQNQSIDQEYCDENELNKQMMRRTNSTSSSSKS